MTQENFQDDETRIEGNKPQDEQKSDETQTVPEKEDTVPEKEPVQKKSGLNSAVTGGIGVVAGVGAAVVLMSFTEPDVPIEDPDIATSGTSGTSGTIPEPDHFDGAEISIAEGVNDGMSFAEAFAAARHEVGAGGVFEWHGGVYGTYYGNEWAGFSDDYKSEFSNFPYHIEHETDSGIEPIDLVTDTTDPIAVTDLAEIVVEGDDVHVLNDPVADQANLSTSVLDSNDAVVIEDESGIATVQGDDLGIDILDNPDAIVDSAVAITDDSDVIPSEDISDTENYISDASDVFDDFNNNADVSDFC
jgi:hypothetical protein